MYSDIKRQLIEFGRLAGGKDLTSGLSGNMSCRAGEDSVVITATSTANAYLEEDDFCVIDLEGNILEGNSKPSSELFLHLEFYKQRPDVNAVLHFHSPYLSAFAISGVEPDKNVVPEIVYAFGSIPLADYALPGSEELVLKTAKYFKDYDIILMKNHGVIAGAKDIRSAYLKLETCENYAKTAICARILGGSKALSDKEVEKIYLLRK